MRYDNEGRWYIMRLKSLREKIVFLTSLVTPATCNMLVGEAGRGMVNWPML